MDIILCELCGVASTTEDQNMLHILGRRHIRNSKYEVNLEHCVRITGFTFRLDMRKLYDHFRRYGKIKFLDVVREQRRKSRPDYAIVEFIDRASVESALRDRHHIGGVAIVVGMPETLLVNEKPVDFDLIRNCITVENQIRTVHTALQLTDTDAVNIENFRATFESEVRQYFPNCSVKLIGSIVNGFGCAGCCVDLLFQTGVETSEQTDFDEEQKPRDIPTANQLKSGDVPMEVLNKLSKFQQLKFIRRTLLPQREEYANVVNSVPLFSYPTIYFLRKTLSYRCYLSNGHSLPLHTTALLQFYGKLDSRVAPLMSVLRRWAKLNNFIDAQRISSYTFSLMVIFFLQTRSPPVLPSVNTLRSKANTITVVDGFDCSFCSDVSKCECSENAQSTESLLLDFFCYYKDYDFFENVISPLTGRCESKMKFYSEENPDMSNFKVAHMCIQDPLETTRNCASKMELPNLLLMIDQFRKVVNEFRNEPEPLADDGVNSWGIPQLLGDLCKRIPRPEPNANTFSFDMVMSYKMLNNLRREFNATDKSVDPSLGKVWIYDVTNLILDILRRVLLLDCQLRGVAATDWRSRKRKRTSEDDQSAPPSKVLRTDSMSSASNAPSSSSAQSTDSNRETEEGQPGSSRNSGVRSLDIRNTPHFAQFVAHSNTVGEQPFLRVDVKGRKTWINRNLPTLQSFRSPLENVFENERKVSLDLVRVQKRKRKNQCKFSCEFYEYHKAGYTILHVRLDLSEIKKCAFELLQFLKLFTKGMVESHF